MRPDPEKIEAIVSILKPTDKHGLLRLLGMIKYMSQYIPDESSMTAPLRSLLKQGAEWSWQHERDAAMDEIRKTLARDTTLAFYDVRNASQPPFKQMRPRVDWGAVSCSRADLWRLHHVCSRFASRVQSFISAYAASVLTCTSTIVLSRPS